MGQPRKVLNDRFRAIVNENVYFQPPQNVSMRYPAVVYSLSHSMALHANNNLYKREARYMVTYITRSPDDPNIESIEAIPLSRFDRSYIKDGLYHHVYTIFN